MVRFQYSRTGLDFTVRNPVFGNTDTLEFSRVSRKSLGGDSIVYRDPTWPKAEVLSHTFDLPPCDIARDNLRQLIFDCLGDYFIYTDFCGNSWKAILKNPDTAITQNGISTFTVQMEMEVIPVTVQTLSVDDALTLNESRSGMIAPVTLTSYPIGAPGDQVPTSFVWDTTNDYVLYESGADDPSEYPGSLVKIMTLLLTYEYKSSVWSSETVTVTAADVTDPIGALSSAGLQDGDIITWEGLAYGLLLPSGFDACLAMARVIGDELYALAGNTGTQGVPRFVERMNARATELGCTNSTYTDPFGGSKTFSPTVVRNILSCRDISKVAKQCFSHAAIRTIGGTVSRGVSITGVNSRTQTMVNFSRFINGPTQVQAGVTDANVLVSKNGIWVPAFSAVSQSHICSLWVSPNGTEVIICTIGSKALFASMMDQRGIMYSLPIDFPYLDTTNPPGTDANYANVQLLVGADGSIVDESNAGRTITTSNVSIGSPVLINSTGSASLDTGSAYYTTPDDAAISVGLADMTVECWFQGTGAIPSGEAIFFNKWNSGTNNREWLIERGALGGLFMFVSSNGSGAANVEIFAGSEGNDATFYNGARRHIALVKQGSTWVTYINGERTTNTISAASAFNGNAPAAIGYPPVSNVSARGTYDDYRVTIGTARYTAGLHTLKAVKMPRS